ncbi:HNH endonuclease [Microbacterium sp. MYb64]|uniref:HNH endonuclease n=1 Tax=Microbacterium sp. MYb64 TaxID=1848691 RepID=UPI000CFB28E3|nr:HNH endonuclease [Microbacterium sp. MYb64]PRB01785.1 hypothetical protein CQ044_16695 [Microbacterium sp. MYb64]
MAVQTLRPGDATPDGIPRRYVNGAGYVRLRWKVGIEQYVEVYEHRFVAGMPSPDLDVHHRNRVRDDNRIENLQVLTPEEHRLLHLDEDRPEFARRRAVRGGHKSRSAFEKAERAKSRRAELHNRSLRMREMYEAGASTTEVGAAFGVDASRVSVHLRRIGTTMRPFKRSNR